MLVHRPGFCFARKTTELAGRNLFNVSVIRGGGEEKRGTSGSQGSERRERDRDT